MTDIYRPRGCYYRFPGCVALLVTSEDDWEDRGYGEKILKEEKRQGWVLTNYYQYTCPACWTKGNEERKRK